MRVELRHQPSFTIARVHLDPGESVRAEAGSMAAHSEGVAVAARAEGGIMKSLKRSMMGGESFFVTTFTAPAEGGWVDVAARLPGDTFVHEVTTPYVLTRGTFLCCDAGVTYDTKWGGFGNLMGGEGGFLGHVTGQGTLVGACYGALDRTELAAGETIVVDSGHLVAYDDSITVRPERAGGAGLGTAFKSGEMLVYHVTGPGTVLTQSRNPDELLAWIIPRVGARQ